MNKPAEVHRNPPYSPVPVAAQAQMSFPMRARGMVFACIGVGDVYPILEIACTNIKQLAVFTT